MIMELMIKFYLFHLELVSFTNLFLLQFFVEISLEKSNSDDKLHNTPTKYFYFLLFFPSLNLAPSSNEHEKFSREEWRNVFFFIENEDATVSFDSQQRLLWPTVEEDQSTPLEFLRTRDFSYKPGHSSNKSIGETPSCYASKVSNFFEFLRSLNLPRHYVSWICSQWMMIIRGGIDSQLLSQRSLGTSKDLIYFSFGNKCSLNVGW